MNLLNPSPANKIPGYATAVAMALDFHSKVHREERVVYRVLMGKPEGRRPLGRPRRRWVDNIRMDLQVVRCGYMDWIALAQDRDRWRTLVSAVISIGLYRSLIAHRLSEIRLPSVTACHHISTGLYHSVRAHRLSELRLPCVTVCHHISM